MDNEWHLVTRHVKKTRKPQEPQQQQPQQQPPAVVESEQVKNIKQNYYKTYGHVIMKKSPSKLKALINNKLDRENEKLKHKMMPFGSGILIQQARKDKGYSQKEFATKINEKLQVVQDYEAGCGIFNSCIIDKMEKVLAIKLVGAKQGKPLKS